MSAEHDTRRYRHDGGRARAKLDQLQRWHRYEVLAGSAERPLRVRTVGVEARTWCQVAPGLYEVEVADAR